MLEIYVSKPEEVYIFKLEKQIPKIMSKKILQTFSSFFVYNTMGNQSLSGTISRAENAVRSRALGGVHLLLFFLLICACPAIQGRTLYVPSDYPTIKSGLINAESGDTIIVLPGSYTGAGNLDLDFGGKAVYLRAFKSSGATIINCQGTSIYPHRAFHFHQGEDSTTIIEGFTFLSGYGPYDGPDGRSIGGAVLCDSGSSPTFIECDFADNSAGFAGGALACLQDSSPKLIECRFRKNRAFYEPASDSSSLGGAVYIENSAPIFEECEFIFNYAHLGGAVAAVQSDPVFNLCQFNINTADHLRDSTFVMNAGMGGGLYSRASRPVLTNCIFLSNAAVKTHS